MSYGRISGCHHHIFGSSRKREALLRRKNKNEESLAMNFPQGYKISAHKHFIVNHFTCPRARPHSKNENSDFPFSPSIKVYQVKFQIESAELRLNPMLTFLHTISLGNIFTLRICLRSDDC